MKNKILASLLAVCLFAGLAVPAFAAGLNSSQEGTSADVTALEFRDKSYDVKENDVLDLGSKLVAYTGTKAICLNPNITWESSDNLVAIVDAAGIVNGITKGKSATITAKSADGKGIATVKVNVLPALDIKATGFRLEAPSAYAFYETTAGTDVLPNFTATLTVAGVKDGSRLTIKVGGGTVVSNVAGSADTTDAKAGPLFNGKKITINGISYTITSTSAALKFTADKKFPATSLPATGDLVVTGKDSAGANVNDSTTAISASDTGLAKAQTIKVIPTPKDATFTDDQQTAVDTAVATAITNLEAEVPALAGAFVYAPGSNKITTDPSVTVAKNTIGTLKVECDKSFPSPVSGANDLSAKASLNIKTAAVTAPKTFVTPASYRLEVGQQFTIKPTASTSNQALSFEYGLDVVGENSYYDFAVVEKDGDGNGKVTAVAVGTNKITTTADNGMTSTTVVEVVAKGTLPVDTGTTTTVLSAWAPKIGVGETANIVVKATKAVTYTSLDTAIATVDAAGKLTAVKEGTAKIKVQEEGKDAVYVSLTVTAKTTTPGGTTDVPQTAVVALAPLF